MAKNKFLALASLAKHNKHLKQKTKPYTLKPNIGDTKMNSDQDQQKNLIDTTDCLEAVGVFRVWKNIFFIITVFFLILLQLSFWLVNTGYVKAEEPPAAVLEEPQQAKEAADNPTSQTEKIQQAAKQVTAEPNQLATTEAKPKKIRPLVGIKIRHITWLIRVADWLLIPTAVLYCLTLLFALKISLLGRLGGINHISRAFFLALIFTVLLLPWQRFFGGITTGVMYTPAELLKAYAAAETRGFFGTIFYYLRFTGYWIIVLLVLIAAQLRSIRWTKAILRRLEVI